MWFEARTAALTSAAGSLSSTATVARSLATAVDEEGSALGAVIQAGAVAAAAAEAVGAVEAQVDVCADGIEYAGAGVGESAVEYDSVDESVSVRLAGGGRAR